MTTLGTGLRLGFVGFGDSVVAVPDQREIRLDDYPATPYPPPVVERDHLRDSIERAEQIDRQHREQLRRLEQQRFERGGRPS